MSGFAKASMKGCPRSRAGSIGETASDDVSGLAATRRAATDEPSRLIGELRMFEQQTHTLTAVECSETGVLGVVLDHVNVSNFADGDLFVMADAIGIAHDLTEHVNGVSAIGSVFDEFQALGAIWYTRGQFADLRRDDVGSALRPVEHIAGDLSRMWGIVDENGIGGHLASDDVSVDVCPSIDAFNEACEIARREIVDIQSSDFECDRAMFGDLDEYLTQALRGMVAGWNKQAARATATEANSRFWNIHDVLAATVFAQLEHEGQTWRVEVDIDDLVTVTELTECAYCGASADASDLDDEYHCEDCSDDEVWKMKRIAASYATLIDEGQNDLESLADEIAIFLRNVAAGEYDG